jgi:hypothetical protein
MEHCSTRYNSTFQSTVAAQFNKTQQCISVRYNSTIQLDTTAQFNQIQQCVLINQSSTIQSKTTVHFSQQKQHNSIRYNSVFQSTTAAQFNQIQQHISVNYSSTIQSDTSAVVSAAALTFSALVIGLGLAAFSTARCSNSLFFSPAVCVKRIKHRAHALHVQLTVCLVAFYPSIL